MKTTGNKAKVYTYRHEFKTDKKLKTLMEEHCEELGMAKAEYIRKAIVERLKKGKKIKGS